VTVIGHIEVRPEHGCHPLWTTADGGARENTDPAVLPIRAELAHDLSAWAAGYRATLDPAHPPDSRSADPGAEDAFWATGLRLACRLAIELVGRYTVAYLDGRLSCLVPLLPAAGGVQVDEGRLRLPDHWVALAHESAQQRRLTDQLRRELSAGHVLDGHDLYLIARCTRCDDVVLRLRDRGYAVVHLAWRQGREVFADWPATDVHSDPAALLADLTDRHL